VRISALAVKHWQVTVIAFVMMAAMGLVSWRQIPRSEDPIFPFPVYPIIAVYPGATPVDMEQLVADPIEDRIRELDDVKTVKTTIEDGVAVIRAEFTWGVDTEKKYDEVMREMNALRPSLPAELRSLEVRKTSAAEVNIVQLALVSEHAPWRVMADAAESLEDRIETVPGVKGAETWGYPEREVRVSLDLGRLAALGIPPVRVLQAIGSESANIPGGSVESGGRRFNVKTSGSYATVDEVRKTVVGAANGSAVLLEHVATVEWRHADEAHLARIDGRRAVFVTATQKEGVNIQDVRDGIWQELDAFEKSLPGGVTLQRGFDQSRNVSERLSRLGTDFAIAILLVLVTLLPLGLRAALVVMVAIPLSLLMGVAALDLTGFGINQLTIVGFVIALGLLVDDSIVVVENIARWLREGHSRRDAAIMATRQIGVAVLGCTATLVFAFVPLMSLPGGPGAFIRSMPVAVVYTVLASLVVSLTITPFLAALVLKEDDHGPEGNRFMRALNRGIGATYAPVLHRALGRPRLTLALAGALFAGSLALIPAVGFSLFPKAGTPQVRVTVVTPEGTSLAETDRAVRFVEGELQRTPGVRTVMANSGAGNPQIYYNIIRENEKPNVGELFVLLDAYDGKRTPAALDGLRARLARYPGARIEVKEFENGPPIDAPVAIRITGESLDTLRTLAARVEQVLRRTPGTMYVDNPVRLARTDLRVRIDRQKAGLLGIPTAEIDRTVRLGLAGLEAGVLRESDGDEHAVVVRLPAPPGRQLLEALDQVHVPSVTGALVPLRQVASLGLESSPPPIEHKHGVRTGNVTSFVRTGFVTDRVTRAVLDSLAAIAFPAGYGWMPAGEIESRQESFGGLGTAVIVAVFGILTILVLEFRTFTSTLIVASVIPLGVVGGILALLVSGYTLSFTAMIGFVALVGIEIKNSILLVDFTNQLRVEGMSLDDAIQRAGEVRFVPIVLTTLTAIGGLLPLALQGSSLYSPLAWVIIGGLVSSTLLARLVTPVMYKLLPPAVEDAEPERRSVDVGALAPA
jgi:multidrug efflux pump subunit AcrB